MIWQGIAGETTFNPHHVRSLEGQGLLLTQFKQYEWATNAFKHAYTVDPEYPYIEGNLMSARLHNCDWTDFESAREHIFEGVRAGRRVCSPPGSAPVCNRKTRRLAGLTRCSPSSATRRGPWPPAGTVMSCSCPTSNP